MMRFHLYLPQLRLTHTAIVERARLAEAAGFEGIAFMDHLAPPLAADQPMWDAMTTAGWTLAHTERLQVGHLVLCDALRQPSVLAREATSLDHASGGRFELGLGWGSVPEELATFGVGTMPARDRVDRLAETLEVLTRLWSGESVDHAGHHHVLAGARQQPVPTRPIPLTIGGVGRRTLALVRRYADWWNVPVDKLAHLAELRDQAGDRVRVSVQQMVAPVLREADRADVEETVRRRFGQVSFYPDIVVGTPAELGEHFAGLAGTGVERVYAWFADFAAPASLEAFAEVIRQMPGGDPRP